MPPTRNDKIACRKCGHKCSKVIDVRTTIIVLLNGEESCAIRRRRQCMKCMARFTTLETYYEEVVQ